MKFRILSVLTLSLLLAPQADAVTYVNAGHDYKAEQAVKNAHVSLPYKVQNMIETTRFYEASDGILGSSSVDAININLAYISSAPDATESRHVRQLYRHEAGHIVDAHSFTTDYRSANLYNGSEEAGRYDYRTGEPERRVAADGFRTKAPIPLKGGQSYAFESPSKGAVIALFYDSGMHVTRYALVSDFIITTRSSERYVHLYSVDAGMHIKDISVRECGALNSFSRDASFYDIYRRSGMDLSRFNQDRHEAFAQFFAYYENYKRGDMSYEDLRRMNLLHIIPYMQKIEKNNYRL